MRNKRCGPKHDLDQLDELSSELIRIHEEMSRLETRALSNQHLLHATHRQSARNLVHYLALRRHDIRRLQQSLTSLGLSSLGGSEAHVKLAVENLLSLLLRLAPSHSTPALEWERMTRVAEWRSLLDEHTANLLGPKTHHRIVPIMVTMPTEAATDYDLVRDLVVEGMDCMRINAAHDGIEEWGRMVANLRKARKATGNECRILMDLPGPKLRTGPIQPGPQVLKWRPHRDAYGRVVNPAHIWLSPVNSAETPSTQPDAHLPLAAECVSSLRPGDVLKFFDARGAWRSVTVTVCIGECRWATSKQTAYVTAGTTLHVHRSQGLSPAAGCPGSEVKVAELPPQPESLVLRTGDILVMTSDSVPGSLPVFDTGRLIQPARIGVNAARDIFRCPPWRKHMAGRRQNRRQDTQGRKR